LLAFLRPNNIPCCQNWVVSPSYNLQVWNTQEIIWSRLSLDPGASQKNKTISLFETTCSAWNGFQTVYSVAIFVIIPRCRKDFHFRHLYLRFVYKINFSIRSQNNMGNNQSEWSVPKLLSGILLYFASVNKRILCDFFYLIKG